MSGVDLRRQLYQLLPAVYRERDDNRYNADGELVQPGQMALLLEAYGELLNGLHGTLQQRYYDNFPDLDVTLDEHERIRSCQEWMLPYFAQLLDVHLVSPDPEGQRAEVSRAVAWRQRKGTRVAAEQVAEAVARMETEIQEGWQRLALTPRIGDPLLPASHYGGSGPADDAAPSQRAGHPGLPAVTPDLRYASRAILSDADNPAARRTRFAGELTSWRQAQRHGAPCFPDSFQDVSRRTPDLRTPRYNRGAYHPRRVILHYPPPAGYFPVGEAGLNWGSQAGDGTVRDLQELQDHPLLEIRSGTTQWHGEEMPFTQYRGLTPTPLRLRGTHTLTERRLYRFDNIWLHNRLDVDDGVVELRDSAARNVVITAADGPGPLLRATHTVLQRCELSSGAAQLEYCTVLQQMIAPRLWASDSIFLTLPRHRVGSSDVPEAGCLRYSRYPFTEAAQWVSNGSPSGLRTHAGTHRAPVFFSETFGEPGCAVLHPAAHAEIRGGAEDGGEMGAYHALRLVLRENAVRQKLDDYLPVGMEAVLVPDSSLLCTPPQDK